MNRKKNIKKLNRKQKTNCKNIDKIESKLNYVGGEFLESSLKAKQISNISIIRKKKKR